MQFKSGYTGQDSMRSKAEAMFSKDGGSAVVEPKESFSSRSHDKMRLYKKGGQVKHTSEMRKAMKGRTKSQVHTPQLNVESGSEMRKMKMGGKMMKDCYAMGGVGKIRHKQATADGMPIKRKLR